MDDTFLHTQLGRTGRRVFRLGLSASYRPGQRAVFRAFDEGMNYYFAYGFDRQMTTSLRAIMQSHRDEVILATGAYNYIVGHGNIRRTCEKRLRQYGIDCLDVFMFLGVMKEKEFPGRVLEEMIRLREEGKTRWIGISTHDRAFAGRVAAKGDLDVLMVRYNAAHRGAEQDIFPHLAAHDPGLVSYTATRWTALLRRPKGWPQSEPLPPAGSLYRFVLSNPHVDLALTAPHTEDELLENLAAVRRGPLSGDEMAFLCRFGDAVHTRQRWFM